MSKITYVDVLELTGQDGTFFSVGFNKRPKPLGKKALAALAAAGEAPPTEGEYREFVCRFGVRKDLTGGGPKYDREAKNLLCVWVPKAHLDTSDVEAMSDERNGDYRSIPCENLKVVKAHGKVWRVQDGMLVEAAE